MTNVLTPTFPMTMRTMLHDAIQNDGGTYTVIMEIDKMRFEPVSHEFGYYVSESRGIENLPTLIADVIEVFASLRIVYGTGAYLGLWKDEFGNWSVDATNWYYSLGSAVAHGKLNDQRAIFDIANGVAIDLTEEVVMM